MFSDIAMCLTEYKCSAQLENDSAHAHMANVFSSEMAKLSTKMANQQHAVGTFSCCNVVCIAGAICK